MCNGEEVHNHEAEAQENCCDKVGEYFSHKGVAAASSDVGPDDILGLGRSLDGGTVLDVVSLKDVFVGVSEYYLYSFEDVQLVKVKDEVSGNVGLESHKNASQLVTIIIIFL